MALRQRAEAIEDIMLRRGLALEALRQRGGTGDDGNSSSSGGSHYRFLSVAARCGSLIVCAAATDDKGRP